MNKHTSEPTWTDYMNDSKYNLLNETLLVKSNLIGRVGIMYLSCGAGAWRIKESLNRIAESLKLTCTISLGLRTLEYTCYSSKSSCTHILNISNTGIDSYKIVQIENFVNNFEEYLTCDIQEVNIKLDKIESSSLNYTDEHIGLWSGIACGAFVFLLGGGLAEMIASLIGATIGQYVRKKTTKKRLNFIIVVIISAFSAIICYATTLCLLETSFHVSSSNQAAYVGAILFIVPGFPFITGVIDISKLYIRSGLERLTYFFLIIIIAALCAEIFGIILNLRPEPFNPLNISPLLLIPLRFIMSWLGVYGFSIAFNSSPKTCFIAAMIGAISNTLRLEAVDITHISISLAALIGSLTVGMIASIFEKKQGLVRVTLTVPAVVIMIPGSFLYRGIYLLGNNEILKGERWIIEALFILCCLPLGLILARIISDKEFRRCS